MQTSTHTLPAHWASYLVNGDATGIDDDDRADCDSFLDSNPDLGPCLSCSDDPFFTRVHEGSYGLACECLEFTFPVLER